MTFVSVLSNEHAFASGLPTKSTESKRTVDKVVIFIFSDGLKSQFTNAKPILDKYGFKATFYVVCNYVNNKKGYMTWEQIETLNKEGHDIGSHTMNHFRLSDLSKKEINYESRYASQCSARRTCNT